MRKITKEKRKNLNPIYFLNSNIEKLYNDGIISTRVFHNLQRLGVKTMNDLKNLIEKKSPILQILGRKTKIDINEIFFLAKIPVKEYW